MKKILAILLAVVFILAFASCTKKQEESTSTPDESKQTSTDTATSTDNNQSNVGIPNIDLSAILAGNGTTDTVWGKQDEATKQQMIAEGKKEGVDISFGADGSMTVVDPESGSTVIQNPDGTWAVKDENGTVGQLGGKWPENEFTKLLPKPPFAILTTANNGDEFSAVFQNASIDDMKEYAKQVASAGFSVNANTEDYSAQGMDVFSYSAVNADGYSISVSYSMGVSAIVMTKP